MKYPLIVLAFVTLAGAGCSRPGSDENAFQWTSELPAGTVVHLRSGAGAIDVRRATDQNIQVTGSRHWRRGHSSDIRFVVTHTGNDYYVCAMWRNSGNCGANGYRGRNTSGFLSMFSLFHRNTDAAADLVAQIPANVVVDAKTSSGSVHVDGMTAGVTARTLNGDVQASNVGGPLTLSTSNGDVHLVTDALAAADSVHLTTMNGTIHAELPANTEGNFDVSTANGTVKSDFPLTAEPRSRVGRHLQGQIGASTRVVKMRSMNGSVIVSTRAAQGHE